MFVEGSFPCLQKIRNAWRKFEVELPALHYAFHRSEKKDAALQKFPTEVRAGIPAKQEGRVLSGNIRGIEHAISMKEGEPSVPLRGPAPGNNVDDPAGSMSKLCFVTRRQHLKLQDGILIKWRRGPAINPVVVWHAVNQEDSVSASLPQDWHGAVCSRISLSADRNARDQLQQVEIVAPIDGHLLDLLRQDSGPGRGTSSLKQGRIR